jgi:hypothetical protein
VGTASEGVATTNAVTVWVGVGGGTVGVEVGVITTATASRSAPFVTSA